MIAIAVRSMLEEYAETTEEVSVSLNQVYEDKKGRFWRTEFFIEHQSVAVRAVVLTGRGWELLAAGQGRVLTLNSVSKLKRFDRQYLF